MRRLFWDVGSLLPAVGGPSGNFCSRIAIDFVALRTRAVRVSIFISSDGVVVGCGLDCGVFKGLVDEGAEFEELDDELDVACKAAGSSWVMSTSVNI